MKKLTALFFFLFSLSALAGIEVLSFSSPQQEKDYQQLTQELRCPQCQNNNIADSNATIAVDMRAKVLELLQEGKSKQDVIDYMVERYGNFITYNPPVTAATLILWVLPVGLLLFGLWFVLRKKNHPEQSHNPAHSTLNAAQQQRLNSILQEKE